LIELNGIRDETSTYTRSRKLAKYLEGIRDKTKREIVIEWAKPENLDWLSGIPSVFLFDPDRIHILINSDMVRLIHQSYLLPLEEIIEELIAHEATHGLLIHGMGFCRSVLENSASDSARKQISILFSMVQDIRVNKILQEEGYSPLGGVYLYQLIDAIDSMRKDEDYYDNYSYDPSLKDRYMVWCYIMAWAYLKYFDLESTDRTTIEKFTKIFENKYPTQFEMASQVRMIILENDILSSGGHNNAMKELVKLWRLEDLVRLEAV